MDAVTDNAPALRTASTLVALPAGQVFVQRWQPEAAPQGSAACPIVLLHESLGSVGQWRDFPVRLAQATGREVLAYDRLGFGRSSVRSDAPSLQFIEQEAQQHFPALMAALGLPRYALLGHSVGGVMALQIAATHPAQCQAVLSLSAQAWVQPRTLEGIRAAQRFFADAQQWARLQKWHGERMDWVFRAWTDVWLHPDFAGWSLDNVLPRVTCPVLAIHGRRDEYGSTEFAQRIATGVARGEVLLLDCAHHPHREQTAQVLAAARDFLRRTLD
jgi:pimeloyl-ACP methyl ester carboxylesterase